MLPVYVALFLVGAISILMWTIAVSSLRRMRRAKATLARMSTTETATVAEAPTNGTVELVGVARPLDASHVVEAPLSGVRCLWWRVEVSEVTSSSIVKIATKSDACDFHLDDGSGALARIMATQAKVELVSPKTVDPYDEERARKFLAKHGIKKELKAVLWLEERIDLEADLYVLGRARPADRPLAQHGGGPFRPAQERERIVVESPADGQLVISVGHEAALAAKLEKERRDASQLGYGFAVAAVVFSGFCAWLAHYAVRSQ